MPARGRGHSQQPRARGEEPFSCPWGQRRRLHNLPGQRPGRLWSLLLWRYSGPTWTRCSVILWFSCPWGQGPLARGPPSDAWPALLGLGPWGLSVLAGQWSRAGHGTRERGPKQQLNIHSRDRGLQADLSQQQAQQPLEKMREKKTPQTSPKPSCAAASRQAGRVSSCIHKSAARKKKEHAETKSCSFRNKTHSKAKQLSGRAAGPPDPPVPSGAH